VEKADKEFTDASCRNSEWPRTISFILGGLPSSRKQSYILSVSVTCFISKIKWRSFMKHRLYLVILSLLLMCTGATDVLADDIVELHYVHSFAHWGPDIQQQIVDEFNRQNPHIRVTIEPINYLQAAELLQIRTVAGVAPDLISIGSDTFSSLAAAGKDLFTDLTPYIERDMAHDRHDIPASVWAATTFNGRTLAMSQRLSIYVTFYNKALFDNAGLNHPPYDWYDSSWNWDTFRTAVSKLTYDTSGDGVPDVYGLANSFPVRLYPWVFQSGGDYLSETYDDFILDQPAGIRAIQFITSLFERGYIGGNFLRGTAAMYTSLPTEMKGAQEQGINWDIAPLPQGPAGPVGKMLTIAVGIPAASAHRDEAWEFLKFYMSADISALQNKADIMPQPRLSVVRNRRNYAPYVTSEHLNVIAQAIELGHVYRYFTPHAPEIYNTIDQALRTIFELKADAATALASIRSKVLQLLKTP
jgi:multiple sugar transport system substrate-binding protein